MARSSMEHRFLSSLLVKILAVAITTSLLSCQTFETSKSESRFDTSIPSDFQLTIGEGGGFTGRWNGFIVDSTGTVFSWRGITPGQNTERITKLARPEFDQLWQTIINARFFDIDTTGTGNITLTMQVTAAGKVHRASWAKPAETQPRLAPVQVLYDACRTIVSRVK